MSARRMAIVGDFDSVVVFRTLGIEPYVAETPADAINVVKSLVAKGYAVVFVTEDIGAKVYDEIEKINLEAQASVLLIPGTKGPTREPFRRLVETVERAVGVNIFAER